MEENKNVYQNMLRLAKQWSTEARQIDSDVNRQFREHLFYRERYSIKQRSLFNVLTAYSMYNSEVSVFLIPHNHHIDKFLFYNGFRVFFFGYIRNRLAIVKECQV